MLAKSLEINRVNINVGIEYAVIVLYNYEPIEGSITKVFSCRVAQKDGQIECDQKELINKYCAMCNDILYSLMRHANELWPLGKWSKQRGYDWHYMSTREDEVSLLKALSRRYYGKGA